MGPTLIRPIETTHDSQRPSAGDHPENFHGQGWLFGALLAFPNAGRTRQGIGILAKPLLQPFRVGCSAGSSEGLPFAQSTAPVSFNTSQNAGFSACDEIVGAFPRRDSPRNQSRAGPHLEDGNPLTGTQMDWHSLFCRWKDRKLYDEMTSARSSHQAVERHGKICWPRSQALDGGPWS